MFNKKYINLNSLYLIPISEINIQIKFVQFIFFLKTLLNWKYKINKDIAFILTKFWGFH